MRVLMLSGPNLNMLGLREPEIYGSDTLQDLEEKVSRWGTSLGIELEARQSNHEGALIDWLQETTADAVVINPGALSHTSRAIADTIRAIPIPVVEVHLSNIMEREPWRAVSVTGEAAVWTIFGRGVPGYRDALRHLVNRAAIPTETIPYGPHPEQVGELRRGGGDLIVLAHGGIWRREYSRDSTESLAVDLTNRGFDTWNVTYRRLGIGGGWPGSGHDVLMALDFIPQLDLDSENVIVMGHSAGAYLAMWAAQRSRTPIALVVALAPLVDLESLVSEHTVCARESQTMLDQGAPSSVSPGPIPTLVIHGAGDNVSPISQSRSLAGAQGVEVIESDCGHFDLLDPTKPEWSRVIERLGAMTRSH